MFIPANENMCTTMQGGSVIDYRAGASYTLGTQGNRSDLYIVDGADHIGEVQAWDLNTGEKVWTHTFESQNWGPLLSTAGGLVFGGGTNDSKFHAYDAKTGDVLWEMKLNSGVIGVPSSFEAGGKQYVAVQAGWGIDAASMQTRLSAAYPDRFKPSATVPTGGVIWAISTRMMRKTPNQIRSKPACFTIGSTTTVVSTIIEMPSMRHPRMMYITASAAISV